jgi:hypothetical protein
MAEMGLICDYDKGKDCIQNCGGETPLQNVRLEEGVAVNTWTDLRDGF